MDTTKRTELEAQLQALVNKTWELTYDDSGLPAVVADFIEEREAALVNKIERLQEARSTEQDIHDWFTSHSSAAVARVVADGQSIIDERMADGVFE